MTDKCPVKVWPNKGPMTARQCSRKAPQSTGGFTMSYDPKCYELAEYFLSSTASERLKDALAQAVQTRVEDWLEYERDELSKTLEASP